jgi:hypothetical protein
MTRVTFRVFNRDGGWRISIDDVESAAFETREEALRVAKIIAGFRRQTGDEVDVSINRGGPAVHASPNAK